MTLHDRIRAVVEERLRIARAVIAFEPYSARIATEQSQALAEALTAHLMANSPADAILSAEHALEILERHQPVQVKGTTKHWCVICNAGESLYNWPCGALLALATRWRVEVDG